MCGPRGGGAIGPAWLWDRRGVQTLDYTPTHSVFVLPPGRNSTQPTQVHPAKAKDAKKKKKVLVVPGKERFLVPWRLKPKNFLFLRPPPP